MIDLNVLPELIATIVSERGKYYDKAALTPYQLKKQMKKKSETDESYPDYYPGYRIAADWLTQIRVHSEKGYFPKWLFENNSPNMTEKEREYVRKNYRQYTLEVFKDYVDTMGRAYTRGNYSIEWPAEAEQYVTGSITSKQYFTTDLPKFESLETYVFEYQAPLKIMDAMGVNVVLPGDIPTIETENGVVVDPEKMIQPYPEFFHTTKVVYYDEHVVIIESLEKSDVLVADKTERTGLVFWIIDDKSWYKAVLFL